MKVFPQRFVAVPLFGVVGAFTVVIFSRDTSFSAVGLLIGGLVGAAVGVLVPLAVLAQDSRILALRARNPEAVVVQGVRDPQTARALASLTANSFGEIALASTFSVLFDRSGFTAWKGAAESELIATVRWADVTAVSLGQPFKPEGWNAKQYQRIRIEATDGNGPVTLQFGVQPDPRLFPDPHLDESGIVELIARVEQLRTGKAGPRATTSTMGSLTPGPTAWAVMRRGLPVMWRAWIAQGFMFLGIVSVLLNWPPTVMWVAIALTVVVYLWFLLGLRQGAKATERERAAGYTTLNGAHLTVEQRHPVSGAVIRAAGQPRLTKQEFADLVR